jgi:hypothetical protein
VSSITAIVNFSWAVVVKLAKVQSAASNALEGSPKHANHCVVPDELIFTCESLVSGTSADSFQAELLKWIVVELVSSVKTHFPTSSPNLIKWSFMLFYFSSSSSFLVSPYCVAIVE